VTIIIDFQEMDVPRLAKLREIISVLASLQFAKISEQYVETESCNLDSNAMIEILLMEMDVLTIA
jgi:hypothetical protein